jgi:hypothetical protein
MLLSGNPCVARISFEWFDQMSEVTWDEVGSEESLAPVVDDLGMRCQRGPPVEGEHAYQK